MCSLSMSESICSLIQPDDAGTAVYEACENLDGGCASLNCGKGVLTARRFHRRR